MTNRYYYNNVPGKGLCRNNLIYTSLINENKTEFVQWYFNDTDYHRGMNEVVDSKLMKEKWEREVKFLLLMEKHYPEHIPEILNIDYDNQKITLKVQGDDFWEQANCNQENFNKVLPDWKEQMLEIIQAHKNLGIYKISIHPSSYFVVDGKLKSINYFFCYTNDDKDITIKSVLSHISLDRRKQLFPQMEAMGIDLNSPASFYDLQLLAFESFQSDYPASFINDAKKIYVQN